MISPRRLAREAAVPLLAACALAVVPASSTESDGAGLLAGGRAPAAAPLGAAARRALLETYAPLVLLSRGERALPAHAERYFAEARVLPGRRGGGGASSWAADARLQPDPRALSGSPDPADWTTLGHVYRSADGGVLVQYWFFYPHNVFHRVGDHEADWEHVTVRIGPDGRPRGAYYARHESNAPGVWVPWGALAREGAHPVVLSAAGSHASYAQPGDVPWYETACPTARPDRAAALGCRAWRTWAGTAGGIEDLGSRGAPRVAYLLWPGRWGTEGGLADDGAGPPGPAFQPGWCSRGAPGCT